MLLSLISLTVFQVTISSVYRAFELSNFYFSAASQSRFTTILAMRFSVEEVLVYFLADGRLKFPLVVVVVA